jgi:hypothetical protein
LLYARHDLIYEAKRRKSHGFRVCVSHQLVLEHGAAGRPETCKNGPEALQGTSRQRADWSAPASQVSLIPLGFHTQSRVISVTV